MKIPAQIEAARVSDADLKRQRERIRRRLTRANTAAVIVLLIVIGLSVAAICQALRAERNAREAGDATRRAEGELWQAQLAQARAQRLTGVAGRKARSLSAVASAAAIRPSVELRDEAIAALALTDVTEEGWWEPARIYTGEQPAFAPDLDLYALGRGGGEISLFRMATREKVLQVQGPPSFAEKIRFSSNGQLLGGHFANGEFMAWSVTNGALLFKIKLGTDPNGMSFDFSPDHRTLAVANQGVRLYDLASGAEVKNLPLAPDASRVSFRPDGVVVAVGVASDIILWSLRENRIMQTLPHEAELAWFEWHPDSQRMASASAANGDLWLWDTPTTNHLILKGHSELLHHLTFSHRGEVLMSAAYDGSTRFWNAGSGELLFVSRAGFGMQFSRDDTHIGYVRENQGLGVWRANPSANYREVNLPPGAARYITGFDFSPDGRALVIANPGGVRVWDLTTGAQLVSAPHANTHAVCFTPEGERIVLVGPDHLHTWNLTSVSNQFALQNKGRLYFEPVLPLDQGSITRGLRHLLAVPSVDRVFCLDLSAPEVSWSLSGNGSMGPMNSAAISADTNWIATSYWKNGRTSVWDTRTRERVRDLGPQGGFVAFSPDNRWLLVGSAQAYRLWEIGSWRQVWEVARRSPGELVGRGAFSPDGRMVALCPEVNLLQLVEVETGQKLASLSAPVPKNTGSVAFSSDGAMLAASTFDNEIQLWNLPETRQQLAGLGLDWTSKEGESGAHVKTANRGGTAGPTALPPDPSLTGIFGGNTFYLLACLGVIVGVCTGVYTLWYHQRMMRNYEEVDQLATERACKLEAAHSELLHSQKMKALGTLAAGIAHDFNNLLSVIRMGNNLLRRPDISPGDKNESSAAVERAVDQGKKVVRSMLGYSREQSESGQAYSVPELVEEVVLLLSQPFLSGLTLTLELNREAPLVLGGRGRLEQILLNLIVNASEAMNGKGRLRIFSRVVSEVRGEFVLRPAPSSRYVEMSVQDSGPGIDAKLRQRVFEPFFSTKPQSAASGTGLGLSLVHSLAQQEGMGIRLESEPGGGALFTILVPVEGAEKMTNKAAAQAGDGMGVDG